MKSSRFGGQEQGILTTTPAALVTPSQSPVPVGFTPAEMPNWGTKLGSTARLESFKGAADTDTRATAETKKAVLNNMIKVKR